MVISSTEFQQNVGHYFDIAERGEPVTVSFKRPKNRTFRVEFVKEEQVDVKIGAVKESKKFINKIKLMAKQQNVQDKYNNGVKLQAKVRQ